jgi:hypothetical protein
VSWARDKRELFQQLWPRWTKLLKTVHRSRLPSGTGLRPLVITHNFPGLALAPRKVNRDPHANRRNSGTPFRVPTGELGNFRGSRAARPPYSFSGLIHRLGWGSPTATPAQPVNKSVGSVDRFGNLGPAPVRISTAARSTSCSRSHRPEPVTQTRIRILRCRHSTSCTIRTAPRVTFN